MKHLRMMRAFARWSTIGLLACSAGGCAAGAGAGTNDDDMVQPIGDGDGDVDGTGNSMGPIGEQTNLEEVRETCAASQSGPPVLRRLTQNEVDSTFRDVFNLESWLGVKLSPDPRSTIGFTNDSSVLVVGGATAKEMLKTAEEVADIVVNNLASVLPCSSSAADRACVEEFINQYGLRLFRRAVTAEDLARYADFQASVAERSSFSKGMKWMLTSMLQSPYAFYRSEIGIEADGKRTLDNYEMASEISYMMVGSTPDEALLAKAAAGELSDPTVRAAEAVRLLSEHPRQYQGMRTFFNEWLNYRTVLGQSRDDDPEFAEEISPRMVSETRFFLDTLVFGDKGTVHDLMTAKYTALDAKLSEFYGYGGITGDFVRADRPAEHGMGILAQGSLLASTSHQAATSPTLRGLLVTERFLCQEAPPVPAVVPTIESTNEGLTANTTREKYENNHASGTVCGECHANFEPFGYTFEGFDEMGRMRTMEGDFPVVTSIDDAPMPDGTLGTFANLDEVASLVNTSTDIQSCVSGLLAAYMFSGAGGTNCLAEEARAKFASGEISIYDYVVGLTAAPHFSTRE